MINMIQNAKDQAAALAMAAYQAANYRWRNWRELYRHALHIPADRLDRQGDLEVCAEW